MSTQAPPIGEVAADHMTDHVSPCALAERVIYLMTSGGESEELKFHDDVRLAIRTATQTACILDRELNPPIFHKDGGIDGDLYESIQKIRDEIAASIAISCTYTCASELPDKDKETIRKLILGVATIQIQNSLVIMLGGEPVDEYEGDDDDIED